MRRACRAHSKTVVGGPEIPLRPQMQVSPTGSAIADAMPHDASTGSLSLVAAMAAKQSRVAPPPSARRSRRWLCRRHPVRRPFAEILLIRGQLSRMLLLG